MKVWITRDSDGDDRCCLFRKNPSQENHVGGVCYYADPVHTFFSANARIFKKNLGFTPRKGSCKLYEIDIKEIK